MYYFTTKVSSVSAMFIRQRKKLFEIVMMILCFDDSSNCSHLIHFMSRMCFLVYKFL